MPGKTAFVYGTLMAPEVVQALIKRVPPMKPATLTGYKRHSVKGVVFPAIVSEDQAFVQGMVSWMLTTQRQAMEFTVSPSYVNLNQSSIPNHSFPLHLIHHAIMHDQRR